MATVTSLVEVASITSVAHLVKGSPLLLHKCKAFKASPLLVRLFLAPQPSHSEHHRPQTMEGSPGTWQP